LGHAVESVVGVAFFAAEVEMVARAEGLGLGGGVGDALEDEGMQPVVGLVVGAGEGADSLVEADSGVGISSVEGISAEGDSSWEKTKGLRPRKITEARLMARVWDRRRLLRVMVFCITKG